LPAARPAVSQLPFYDVDGNGYCAPLDVLLVINQINAPSAGGGEGEPTAQPSDALWFAVGESREPIIPAFFAPRLESPGAPTASVGGPLAIRPHPSVLPAAAAPLSPADRLDSWCDARVRHIELETILEDLVAEIE
jgi:hypothetical protein